MKITGLPGQDVETSSPVKLTYFYADFLLGNEDVKGWDEGVQVSLSSDFSNPFAMEAIELEIDNATRDGLRTANLNPATKYYYRYYYKRAFSNAFGTDEKEPKSIVYGATQEFTTPVDCNFNFLPNVDFYFVTETEGHIDAVAGFPQMTLPLEISGNVNLEAAKPFIAATGICMDANPDNLTLGNCAVNKDLELTVDGLELEWQRKECLYDAGFAKGEPVYFRPYVVVKNGLAAEPETKYGAVQTMVTVSCFDEDGIPYIDLGLPSGTLWAAYNLWPKSQYSIWQHCDIYTGGGYTYAMDFANESFPTEEEIKELMTNCTASTFKFAEGTVEAIKLIGAGGSRIDIPLAGYTNKMNLEYVGENNAAYFWISGEENEGKIATISKDFIFGTVSPAGLPYENPQYNVRKVKRPFVSQ